MAMGSCIARLLELALFGPHRGDALKMAGPLLALIQGCPANLAPEYGRFCFPPKIPGPGSSSARGAFGEVGVPEV